ncbi:MAG: hypothetical protein PHH40_01925 [Candidatus Moranbacteria bacterium]|nr:hypothetical protein [Candidatus Moranbacteria bacterium]MDD3965022.1 hypothetical protein [Candidatus Moranbacteria bacterium]
MKSEARELLPAEAYVDLVSNPLIDHWSHIRCGSYTAEWVAKAVGVRSLSSNKLLRGPVWFDLFRPVFPRDMKELFKAHNMTTLEIRLDAITNEERLEWIRTEIALKKRPPVLLIRANTLHWIAVGGYSDVKKVFYIYDSRIGSDSFDNRLPIGNMEMPYDVLLQEWSGRWFLRYVALIITNVQVRDLKKEKISSILESYARGELIQKVPLQSSMSQSRHSD